MSRYYSGFSQANSTSQGNNPQIRDTAAPDPVSPHHVFQMKLELLQIQGRILRSLAESIELAYS
jgi:hypothetical protein